MVKISCATLVECCVSWQHWQQSSPSGKRRHSLVSHRLGLTVPRSSLQMLLSFPSSLLQWWWMPTLPLVFSFQTFLHPTSDTFSWGQFWYSCSVGQGWVLGNCQNRRNCDVPGFAGIRPAGSMRQQVKHRLRTQSRPNPHLLLQLTNPDMSHFTCTDSLHPWDVSTNLGLI